MLRFFASVYFRIKRTLLLSTAGGICLLLSNWEGACVADQLDQLMSCPVSEAVVFWADFLEVLESFGLLHLETGV